MRDREQAKKKTKRANNCDHAHWLVRPGNLVECKHCGDTIEQDDIDVWVDSCSNPIEIEMGSLSDMQRP